MNLLEVKDLTAGYGRRPIARDLSFSVEGGEILALIGQNGSGKSTVLKTLSGHLPILSGTVSVAGRDTAAMSRNDFAKAVSVMLTDRPKTDMMTCRDVVETGRYPYTGSFGLLSARDRAAADEAMRLTDTEELAGTRFGEISDGQKQRVLLARAVCREPKVLLLDEPTSFLDIHYKLTFLAMLDRLRKERDLAVVLSLHETDLAGRIADTVLLLKKGVCTGLGKPEDLLTRERLIEHFEIPGELYDKYSG